MNQFTTIQLEKIKNLLEHFRKCNTDKFSYFKVYNIKTYNDQQGNFYISYTTEAVTADGVDMINSYIKILRDGTEIRLNDVMNQKQLNELFSTLQKNIL